MRILDEAHDAQGRPRAHYAALLEQLARRNLARLREDVAARLAADGCSFGDDPFVVDPVPRLVTPAEWEQLKAGLEQRVRALEAFVRDVHGPRRALRAGAIPERVVAGATYREPHADRTEPATWIGVAGVDLVRAPDGRFLVLEDNLRTPSGLGYAIGARRAVGAELDLPPAADPAAAVRDLLRRALRSAAPRGAGAQPRVVLLSDGEANSAWWEHRLLADLLGIELATPGELRPDGARLVCGDGPVDVVYRRTDVDRLYEADGSPTAIGELLDVPLRAGTVACVNAPGAGVADDKLVYPYVPALVRELLGEEPLLGQVETFDLEDDGRRAEALERIAELVVKPREAYGGRGVTVCPDAEPEDVRAAARAIEREPHRWIAQETVRFSSHPTVIGGGLAPRHVDLRAFVVVADGAAHAVPGGLSRVALGEGELVVNSSQGGGAKDTVVLSEG